MHYSGKNSGKLFNSSTKYIKPEFCEVSLRVLQGKMIENKLVIYFYINVQWQWLRNLISYFINGFPVLLVSVQWYILTWLRQF